MWIELEVLSVGWNSVLVNEVQVPIEAQRVVEDADESSDSSCLVRRVLDSDYPHVLITRSHEASEDERNDVDSRVAAQETPISGLQWESADEWSGAA